jgi:hypothetical protein
VSITWVPTLKCACGYVEARGDVLDMAYECGRRHYFTRPEAGDTNVCPECGLLGRRLALACPECREPLA